jgi:hypothetical protein
MFCNCTTSSLREISGFICLNYAYIAMGLVMVAPDIGNILCRICPNCWLFSRPTLDWVIIPFFSFSNSVSQVLIHMFLEQAVVVVDAPDDLLVLAHQLCQHPPHHRLNHSSFLPPHPHLPSLPSSI